MKAAKKVKYSQFKKIKSPKYKKKVLFSEYISNIIKYKLEDDGINCCDPNNLDEFKKWTEKLIKDVLKEYKIENKAQ